MDILVFDLFADYGHFKVPYTITSPLTLPVPSKTAVFGIIGAITGLDKNDYLAHFQGDICKIALAVKRPVKKIRLAENLINTKKVLASDMFARMNPRKSAPHSPTRIEFLKDPGYRIYVHHRDQGIFDSLCRLLENHQTVYTVSLGISECLANFNYTGRYTAHSIENNHDFVEINSILPSHYISEAGDLALNNDTYLLKVHLPLEMKENRQLVKTGDFLIEANSKPLSVKANNYHRIEPLNENVIFF